MKKIMLGLAIMLFLFQGCSIMEPPKYGFLSGGDYPFYKPFGVIDLKGIKMNFTLNDKRNETNKVECSNIEIQRDSELEGEFGKKYFENYLIKTIQHCNGKINTSAQNNFTIDLEALFPKMDGFGYVRVYGFVQFFVTSKSINKRYCISINDGDQDSPLGKYSFTTRRGAMRKMIAAAMRKGIEEFMTDLQNVKQ